HLSAHRGMRVPGGIDLQEPLFTALAEGLFTHPAAGLDDPAARLGAATSWGLTSTTAAAITAPASAAHQPHQSRPHTREVSGGAPRTVLHLAHDLEADRRQLHYGTSRSYPPTRLAGVPGIDQGTAQRLTRRTLGDADDLREEDPAVIRGAVACGLPSDPDALAAHGQRWAPWRSYAAMHLRAASTGHP